jgi:hypothetical protein
MQCLLPKKICCIRFCEGFRVSVCLLELRNDVVVLQEVCAEASASAEKLSGAVAAGSVQPISRRRRPPPQASCRPSPRKSLSACFAVAKKCAGSRPSFFTHPLPPPPPSLYAISAKGYNPSS